MIINIAEMLLRNGFVTLVFINGPTKRLDAIFMQHYHTAMLRQSSTNDLFVSPDIHPQIW